MQKIWFVPFLVASALVLIVCFVQGVSAIVYPLSLTLSFFVGYLVMGFRASLQAGLNPGLKKLEPSFWSSLYDAWLWVTDRKRWKVYACMYYWSYNRHDFWLCTLTSFQEDKFLYIRNIPDKLGFRHIPDVDDSYLDSEKMIIARVCGIKI